MRHISTIHPIAAFFSGPATRPRQVGRPAEAGATRNGRPIERFPAKLDGRSAAGDQSYGAGTSDSDDSVSASPIFPSPSSTPPFTTGERAACSASDPERAAHGARV